MFVLALGVNKYRMNEYQLNYAATDATSFAKALQVVGSTLFAEVKPIALTDEQVNEADISSAINKIAQDAKPDDVFVLFLGGHGKSIAGRYYYYPQSQLQNVGSLRRRAAALPPEVEEFGQLLQFLARQGRFSTQFSRQELEVQV